MTRRRAFLHLVGLLWITEGLWVSSAAEEFSRPGPSPLDWMDSNWWGLLWIISGSVAFWVSLDRRLSDSLGFTVLIAPTLVWASFGTYSLLVAVATGGQFGHWHAWTDVTRWALDAAIIRVVANWDDPLPPPLLRIMPPSRAEGGVRDRGAIEAEG